MPSTGIRGHSTGDVGGSLLCWSPWTVMPGLSYARHCTNRYFLAITVIFHFPRHYQYRAIPTGYSKLTLTLVNVHFPAHHIPWLIPDASQSPLASFPHGPPGNSTKKVKTFSTPSYGRPVWDKLPHLPTLDHGFLHRGGEGNACSGQVCPVWWRGASP